MLARERARTRRRRRRLPTNAAADSPPPSSHTHTSIVFTHTHTHTHPPPHGPCPCPLEECSLMEQLLPTLTFAFFGILNQVDQFVAIPRSLATLNVYVYVPEVPFFFPSSDFSARPPFAPFARRGERGHFLAIELLEPSHARSGGTTTSMPGVHQLFPAVLARAAISHLLVAIPAGRFAAPNRRLGDKPDPMCFSR